MTRNFFPSRPEASPKIYAYILPDVKTHEGFIKIGYTTKDVITRIQQQTQTAALKYKILMTEPAVRPDGSTFTDKDIHAVLRRKGYAHKGEWFRCTLDDVRAAFTAVRTRTYNTENRTEYFAMRPEQSEAVMKTMKYFAQAKTESPEVPEQSQARSKRRTR